MATRLCFSVEYRHSSEQLMVSLLRLGNLPPCFHANVTLVQLRLLPDDRRPRQAKARGTGPDPEFNDCFIFQVRTQIGDTKAADNYATLSLCFLQVSGVCVPQSILSVCVMSVTQDGKRQAVGRVLFPLEGELGQAGRVLWRDLETEDDTQVYTQMMHVDKIWSASVLINPFKSLSALRAGRRAGISELQSISAAPLCGGSEGSRPTAAHRCR